jgi:hypothetical protein
MTVSASPHRSSSTLVAQPRRARRERRHHRARVQMLLSSSRTSVNRCPLPAGSISVVRRRTVSSTVRTAFRVTGPTTAGSGVRGRPTPVGGQLTKPTLLGVRVVDGAERLRRSGAGLFLNAVHDETTPRVRHRSDIFGELPSRLLTFSRKRLLPIQTLSFFFNLAGGMTADSVVLRGVSA